MEHKYSLDDFRQIIKRLRGESGCPWDKVQTHETLRKDMLEEAYEAVEAIDRKDMKNLKEELGDVLLQVVFHSSLAEDEGAFTFDDVVQSVCEKMIYRHPHVFGSGKADTPEEVLVNWEDLKKKEKHAETQTQMMADVPLALPALTRAAKVQKKAAAVGFDFAKTQEAWEKVKEEIAELEAEMEKMDGNIEEEFGDVLFAMVNVARFLQINPEFSLTKATKKFINRFEYIENSALTEGKQLSSMTLKEMDLLWDKAKEALAKER